MICPGMPYCQHLRWTERDAKTPAPTDDAVLVHRYCTDCHELIHTYVRVLSTK